MRTTPQLDEKLLQEVEILAAESGRSVTALIEETLRELVARRKSAIIAQPQEKGNDAEKKEQINLPTFSSGGYLCGDNLDDNSAVRDHLDEHDPESRYKCF